MSCGRNEDRYIKIESHSGVKLVLPSEWIDQIDQGFFFVWD